MSSLIDPINTIISLLGVVAAFLVANYRGEMAATKYAQRETKRMKHAKILVTQPLSLFMRRLYHINSIFGSRPKKIDIHNLKKTPDFEFFIEHLNTGYQPLFQTFCGYKDHYNEIVDQVIETYQRAEYLLVQKWRREPDFNTIEPPLKSYISQFIAHFSEEVTRRLINDTEPKISSLHPQDTEKIIVGSAHIEIYGLEDREKVVNDLNLILESSEVFGKLQQLLEKAKPLLEEYDEIHYQLNLIRSLVNAEVPLEGSCKAGRKANYESNRVILKR